LIVQAQDSSFQYYINQPRIMEADNIAIILENLASPGK